MHHRAGRGIAVCLIFCTASLWNEFTLKSQPAITVTRDSVTQRPPALSVEDIVDRAVMRQSAVLSRGIEYLYDLHARTVNR